MKIVELPDTPIELEFPDDMSDEDIKKAMGKFNPQFGQQLREFRLENRPQGIEAVEPTLAESMGYGIANLLYSSGIMSDRIRAQEVGDTMSAIFGFSTGVGDAQAGDDFGRSLRQGDGLGTTLGLMSAVPILGKAMPSKQATEKFFSDTVIGSLTKDATDPRSRTTALWLTPEEFKQLAQPLGEIDSNSRSTINMIKESLESGGKIPDPMFIHIDHDTKGVAKVVGHEGRHRAEALSQIIGENERIPVAFHSRGAEIRWGMQKEGGFDRTKVWPEYLVSEDGTKTFKFPLTRTDTPEGAKIAQLDALTPTKLPKPKKLGDFTSKEAELLRDEVYDEFYLRVPEGEDVAFMNYYYDDFSPEMRNMLKALERDDWLGFSYPDEALDVVFSERGLDDYEVSPSTRSAITKYIRAKLD